MGQDIYATMNGIFAQYEAERDALRAEVERLRGELAGMVPYTATVQPYEAELAKLRGELAAAKAEDSRNRKDFRSAIDNWIATANDYMERWKEASIRAESAEAHAADLRVASQAVIGRWDSPAWKTYTPTASTINQLRVALTHTPAQSLAAIQARALREAADEIAVELVHWTDDGYGLAARSEREIMIHRLRSKAERLEKEATDAPR